MNNLQLDSLFDFRRHSWTARVVIRTGSVEGIEGLPFRASFAGIDNPAPVRDLSSTPSAVSWSPVHSAARRGGGGRRNTDLRASCPFEGRPQAR